MLVFPKFSELNGLGLCNFPSIYVFCYSIFLLMLIYFTGKETGNYRDSIRELKVLLYHPWISVQADENNGYFSSKE